MPNSSSTLRITAAQINSTVGDIAGNAKKIIASCLQARDVQHADLIIFPEMSITGYPPEDLLLRTDLYLEINQALDDIKRQTQNIAVIVGYPIRKEQEIYNSAALISDGQIVITYSKHQLPNYGVFDEKRYFTPGTEPAVTSVKGVKIGITICEDLWFPMQIQEAKAAGAELVISINASPFDMYKPFLREKTIGNRAREAALPIVYVNCVGGQDELVFDGGSMVFNKDGEVTQRADFLVEDLMSIDFKIDKKLIPLAKEVLPISNIEDRVYKALVLGIRDYIEKNNFKGVIIGLSGGIDSVLTLAIAVDALSKDKVETIYMPSRYSSKLSEEVAEQCSQTLGVKYRSISIEPIFQAFLDSLKDEFAGMPQDATEENLQARCRGTLLMAMSNKKKLIVLSTGNKSEMSVGYATLYGDMVGGFCALKDVPKTLVYRLANYRNNISPAIPQNAIDRPPSAELAKDQKDEDSLPPYPILDAILERYVEHDQSPEEIVKAGFNEETVVRVITMVDRNEYKRRQAPPGVRVTARAFGRDRRYPITSKF